MNHVVQIILILVGLFCLPYSSNIPQLTSIIATTISICFPILSRFIFNRSRQAVSRDQIQTIVLILLGALTIIELLVKSNDHLKHFLQVLSCICVSNSLLFLKPETDTEPVNSEMNQETDTSPGSSTPGEEAVLSPEQSVLSSNNENNSTTGTDNNQASRNETAGGASTNHNDPTKDTTKTSDTKTTDHPAVSMKLAENGNGFGQPLSEEQISLCQRLFNQILQDFGAQFQERNCEKEMLEFCTMETCRRFLVARNWSFSKALAQITSTIEWRMKQEPWTFQMKDNKQCKENPYAYTLRLAGLDAMRRPVIFSTFLHALDRFNPEKGIVMFEVLLEEARRIIARQFREGVTQTADQQQWVLVIDFTGFSLRDASPTMTYQGGRLMNYFPEMLNQVVLLDAPMLFSGAWNMLNPVLDDRVRAKVLFTSLNKVRSKLEGKLGEEMMNWIIKECESSRKHKSSVGKRAYWQIQKDGHDPRGVPSYINSPYYVETPGEYWAKQQQQQ